VSPAPSAGLPLSEDEARRAAGYVLDQPGADGVEVFVSGSRTGLTRYANSEIIQNTSRAEVRAEVRVAVAGKLATATTNQLDRDSMEETARAALWAAGASRRDEEWPGFADPREVGRPEAMFRWDEDTAAAPPNARAAAVSRILRTLNGLKAAGIYETSAHAYSVFSSTGVECYDAHTRCVTTCLAEGASSTGWGEQSSHSVQEVDVETAARRAGDKVEAGKTARDARPGAYEVVLEPPAAASLIEYLSFAGFGAKQMIEGESFLSTRRGELVAAQSITVADDVAHPCSVGIGFDFEGVPRRRVAVIDEGRAADPVNDLRTARKLEAWPTGHSSGSTEFGPFAFNVVLKQGESSFEDLIGSVERGLLITRFHYINILDRPATLLTGMTRDGTFALSGGEITGAVHNLRFTQNVLEALASTLLVGRDLCAFAPEYGPFGSVAAPALRLGEFHFTSTTSH
jgi:PmbA protein